MKPVWKRTVALTLATALTAGLVIPAMAASNNGTDTGVYDDVLGIREKHYKDSIQLSNGEANFTGDEWYDDSEVIGINRERAKSQFISYQDAATALAAEKSVLDDVGPESSTYYKLLSDTNWDFALVENPAEAAKVDATYLAKDYTGDAFQKEYVPQAWQTYRNEDGTFKYFDEPIYTNTVLPWFNNFESDTYTDPTAPTKYNPVGYYRTSFTLPDGWDGREVFISFQSVESAYYLYVNGQKVGYSTDSFTAHDFNITPYLNKSGENTIALKVFRWSIGSWLENQDFIRQSGIYRDVYLYSKDEAEIRDFFVKTDFVDRTSETSDVNVTVETDVRALFNKAQGTYTVSAHIEDQAGNTVATADNQTVTLDAASTDYAVKLADAGRTVTSTMKVRNPAKWFPDTPNLYSLVLELKKADGTVMEAVVERIGFREIYKVNIDNQGHEQMQITGRQVVLRGVNRHDTDLETGHALTFEDYLTDLTVMKENNLNAIRTAHYPNDKALYDLADELGLYVCAEANVESHAAASNGDKVPTGTGSGMPEWVAPVLDRVATNLEMYKNNPSVIMWSLGNEATYSWAPLNENYCFWVASMYLLKRDPDRLRKYERESDGYQHSYEKAAGADPWSVNVRKANIVDIHSTQYSLPSNVANYNGKMPYVHSEYNHAMGQAYGNALEHWDVIRQKDNVQGGFIWDYIDQSIRTVRQNSDGTYDEFWGYGGDWIDTKVNDNAFCGNGLLFADRTPSPKMTEAKKVHQQVSFYMDDLSITSGGEVAVEVINEYENTSLSAFDITWKLTEDGVKTLDSGTLELNTPNMDGQSLMSGQQVANVTITLKDFEAVEGRDYLLDFSVTLKKDTNWAKAGHEVAYEQFQLDVTNAGAAADTQAPDKDFQSVRQVGSELILTGTTDNGQKFEITLDTKNGVIKSYKLDGNVVMTQGPEQSLYRAETYNDTTVQKDSNLKNAGAAENLSGLNVAVTKADNQVLMAMSGSMKVDADALMAYQIYGNGEIVVLSQFIPTSNFAPNGLPKIGGRMLISGEYDKLTYYGRGPDENYVDRQSGSTVGVYTSTVYDPNDAMGADSTWVGKKMLKPQDNGNRTDIRWTALTNEQGVGLMVTSDDQLLESSVAHYTAEEMNSGSYNSSTYRHPNQIPQGEDIVWNLDLHQNGVSDTAFMSHKPLNGYFFPTNQTYSYSYRISPVSTKDPTELMKKGNEGFEVPTSTYPITSISINGKEVAGFDVGSETGSSYTLAANESITSVTVEGTENYTCTFNEDGTLTVTAANNYGQEFNYVVKLVREGKELDRSVLSNVKVDNNHNDQPGSNLIDGDESSIWHSNWKATPLNKLWFMVELDAETAINGIRYLPRQDTNGGKPSYNGTFGDHDIYVSSKTVDQLSGDPSSDGWTKVATGSWAKNTNWKTTSFGSVATVRSILVVPRSTYGDTVNAWGSGAEFRVTGATAIDTSEVTVTLEESSYPYKGEPVRPIPVVKRGEQTLICGLDYTVEYANNQQAGNATLTVNFTGAFTGDAIEKAFTITEGSQRTLTLNLGSGTSEKQVYVGQTITLEAGEAPENKMFDHWSSTSKNVTFEDAYSENTTFVMPDENVTVTANYMDGYTVTVVGGSLDEEGTITSQMYKVGSSVTFFADIPEGKVFDHWATDGEDARITDAYRNPALMDTMPARDVVVTAHFVTDPHYFEVLDNLPDHRYLGQTFTPPATLRVIQGDEQSDAQVTWNQAQVNAINAATEVSTLPLTGTVAGHDVSTTVAVVPGNVVYFVDAGASAFTDAVANILKYNAATLLNSAPDQAYTQESGWGYTNPDSQVEAHEDYGTDIYSTIRNMTASSVTNGGHGKPLVYQFDGLEAGTYQVYVGYKNIWYQTKWQRNATIELLQDDQQLATVDKNLNVQNGQYAQLEMTLTEAGSVKLKMSPKATDNDNNDMLVSFIVITKDGDIVQPEEYSITVNKEGQGTASAYPTSAAAGDTVTLFQQAAEGWHFVEWKSDDVTVTGNTFTMPAKNVTVTAVFEKDAHTHTYGEPAFTFSKDGKTATAVFTCACDNKLEMDAAVTAKVKEKATCTQMGTTTYTATVKFGEETYTDTLDVQDIPVTGHTQETIPGKAATCTQDGLTDGVKCSVCGEILVEQEVIKATGHHYVDGVCTNCGAKDPNYVPPTENPDPDPSTPVDPEPSAPVTGGDVILDNNTDNRITVGNADKVFEANTVITVESVTQGKIYDTVKEALKDVVADMKNTAILDITATLNGKPVQPNGKVQMTFAIPENLSVDNLKLFYVSDDGKTTEEIAITVDKDARTVTANLEHFSTYVLANVAVDEDGKVPPTGDANQMLLYVAAMAVSMSLLCGAVVVSRKRKG